MPNNVRQTPDSITFNCCKACKQLIHDIGQLQQSAEKVSTSTRYTRRSVSSNYPVSKLSPGSQFVRLAKVSEERKQHYKALKKFNRFDYDVSDKQHEELMQLVSTISRSGSKAVLEMIAAGDRVLGEEGTALRQAWKQDVTERLEFEKDQSKTGTI